MTDDSRLLPSNGVTLLRELPYCTCNDTPYALQGGHRTSCPSQWVDDVVGEIERIREALEQCYSIWSHYQGDHPAYVDQMADIINRALSGDSSAPETGVDPLAVAVSTMTYEWARLSHLADELLAVTADDPLSPSGRTPFEVTSDMIAVIKGHAQETSGELERLRELQEKALALDDAVAEFGIDKPQYIAEVYQAFHDVLHDGHGCPSVVEISERECACIPMAPRDGKFCTDCGGRIPRKATAPCSYVSSEGHCTLAPHDESVPHEISRHWGAV